MISDITLGQFFPGNSFLHRLDPRTKILLSTVFIVTVFVASTPMAFLLVTLFTAFLMAISGIRASVIFKGIKPILFILIFTTIINILMTRGTGDPLVSFWIIHIYKEGLIRAFFMTLRVILLIIGTSLLLTYTTSPISLTDGLESLLAPLEKLHIPVHIFSMMMTIALRFIPTLVEETEKIMNAQKSRGADFSSGNLIKRAKSLIPLLIPLFASAFKRAEELAVAMECRCYRVDKKRTKMTHRKMVLSDWLSLLFMAVFLAVIIVSTRLAPGEDLFSKLAFYKI
ncbi:MAG TPA: transporter [Clostridiales bacterium]|nr:transporter [Clostridiales bacterium]